MPASAMELKLGGLQYPAKLGCNSGNVGCNTQHGADGATVVPPAVSECMRAGRHRKPVDNPLQPTLKTDTANPKGYL